MKDTSLYQSALKPKNGGKVTILLGDKSPIEQEAIGTIFQKSHLLLLGASADIQEPEYQTPSTFGVCIAEWACTCAQRQNQKVITQSRSPWDNWTAKSTISWFSLRWRAAHCWLLFRKTLWRNRLTQVKASESPTPLGEYCVVQRVWPIQSMGCNKRGELT